MKRLSLKSETLALLTSDELSAVAGAAGTTTMTNTLKCLTEDSVLICRTVPHTDVC